MTGDLDLRGGWRRRVEQSLGRDIADPGHRRTSIVWERHNLARDIESARNGGAYREAQGLRSYARRPWQELIALDGAVAPN